MKRILVYFLIVCSLFVLASCDSGTTTSEKIEIAESAVKQEVKSLMVDGATLGDVRPSENELSEEEILLKFANTIAELGYYNDTFMDEIDPKLKNSKIETPEYVYQTSQFFDGNGYYLLYAVDDNGLIVASATCNADKDKDKFDFIGSYGPCTAVDAHIITKREISELLKEKMPDKEFTEPVLVSAKVNGSPMDEDYWYVASVEGSSESASKALATNSDTVEEYLIDCGITNYVPSKQGVSKALATTDSESDTNCWGGIMKVDGKLGYYKVIEANKTVVDEQTNGVKALNTDSFYSEYRGQKLSSLHSGQIETTKIN